MYEHKIYIARHGITNWNKLGRIQGQGNNFELSSEGIAQMAFLGKYLSITQENYIVALSPMKRAQESFEIVNKYLNIKKEDIFIIDELKEMNFGSFEGKLKSEITEHPFFEERRTKKWTTRYPNGESYSDLFKRLSSSELNNIFQQAKENRISILTIGHESINRVIPQVLTPELESNEQASKNRQKNNEIIVIKQNLKRKITIPNCF